MDKVEKKRNISRVCFPIFWEPFVYTYTRSRIPRNCVTRYTRGAQENDDARHDNFQVDLQDSSSSSKSQNVSGIFIKNVLPNSPAGRAGGLQVIIIISRSVMPYTYTPAQINYHIH